MGMREKKTVFLEVSFRGLQDTDGKNGGIRDNGIKRNVRSLSLTEKMSLRMQ